MKLWQARFAEKYDAEFHLFNRSLPVDQRMLKCDLTGSLAHVKMLGKQGILAADEAERLAHEIETILARPEQLLEELSAAELDEVEDVHSLVEAALTARLGETGKRLHTGRSRNDQVAVDIRLYLRERLTEIAQLLVEAISACCHLAERHVETIMPGYTHLQMAQPVTFAHWILAYAQMLRRDLTKVTSTLEELDECPLGAGALATSSHPLDRAYVAELLGFTRVAQNSLDAVSNRDFILSAHFCLSTIMVHLSKLCEELITFSSVEFGYVTLPDAYSTGSSMMPQKKNPDLPELVRGKSAGVIGRLQSAFVLLKALPLAYNKDLQEDKEALFVSLDTVETSLRLMTRLISGLEPRAERMLRAAQRGYMNATDLADYLVSKGVPFRTAYGVVGKLVRHCVEADCSLEEVPLAKLREFSPDFSADVYDFISIPACVQRREVVGGPAPQAVKAQLTALVESLPARFRIPEAG